MNRNPWWCSYRADDLYWWRINRQWGIALWPYGATPAEHAKALIGPWYIIGSWAIAIMKPTR